MAYTRHLQPSAQRDVEGLIKEIQRRVARKLETLSANPRPHGVQKLKGRTEPLYRIRTGDYRIVYAIHDKVLVVLVVRVQHRREVYRGM